MSTQPIETELIETPPVSIPAIIGGQHALVYVLPECDPHAVLGVRQQARYDALWPLMGTWASMCPSCFEEAGCSLGVGRGQMMVLPHEVENFFAENPIPASPESPPDVPRGLDLREYMTIEWEADHR